MLSSVATNAQTAQNLKNAWGDIDTDIEPWVTNVSRPNTPQKGLAGRHISIWASHGRIYDNEKGRWKWQRPNLFSTNEDLFTQTIVVPYLIPMLENAGAYVFTPRERDWQKNEIIVDNDTNDGSGVLLLTGLDDYSATQGFGYHTGTYKDGENPFTAGTAMMMKTTKSKKAGTISYVPEIREPGRYAVYVSYPYMEYAVDDAHYTVCHKGIRTEFVVNQQIGYGTWVYLGTFDFGLSNPELGAQDNCVILSTESGNKGYIGADAVRFGGGMGNIQRGDALSGLPRCLEGARYWAQWAGAPYWVYSDKQGENDYADDINVRSLMTNWLGGGSCYIPSSEGRGVPFEMTLAVHSDAGYHHDGKSIFGSLAIATTSFNDGMLASGISRQTSLDLASQLLNNLNRDMTNTFGRWEKRYLWDRNYSETRLPEVPSAIIETLSHQSFPDMLIGEHPYGKFTIARSIYKTVARYICDQHGKPCVIAPLQPTNFRLSLDGGDKVRLEWAGVKDPQEPSAIPTSYNIYTSTGTVGFDNGQNVESTVATMRLVPGIQYNFRITACNEGGESFPTETLSAYIAPESKGTLLVVGAFERLAAPYVIASDTQQGFDLSRDEGVQRGLYAGWAGRQKIFDKEKMGQTGEGGLGYCGDELAGQFVRGNDFNYVTDHTRAIASSKRYSVVSCSLAALRNNLIDLRQYRLVDIAFGLQKDDGQLGIHYKTFTSSIRKQLEGYAQKGGAILVSGAFIGSDMPYKEERAFLQNLLKLCYYPSDTYSLTDEIIGLGMRYDIFHHLNSSHYAATHPEVLSPVDGGICAMQYSDGTSAAVGYKGKYSCFTIGFPFECIKEPTLKDKIMQGILAYLL